MRVLTTGNGEPLLYLAFSPDGRRLAASAMTEVWLWDLAGDAGPAAVSGDRGEIAFSGPGHLVVARRFGGVQGWAVDERPYRLVHRFDPGDGPRLALDGRRLAVQTGGQLDCRAVADGELLWRADAPDPRGLLAFTPDGSRLYRLDASRLDAFDASQGTAVGGFDLPDEPRRPIGLAVAPDRRTLAVSRAIGSGPPSRVSSSFRVFKTLHDADTGKILAELPPVPGLMAFTPIGRLATIRDDTVEFREPGTWHVFETFAPGVGRLRELAFSPDGMLAAAAGSEGRVAVWDAG